MCFLHRREIPENKGRVLRVKPPSSLPPTHPRSLQIKVWTANPQQFVEDEDDDTFSYTVRIAAQDLLLVSAAEAADSSPL